jgi:hypothetical protein
MRAPSPETLAAAAALRAALEDVRVDRDEADRIWQAAPSEVRESYLFALLEDAARINGAARHVLDVACGSELLHLRAPMLAALHDLAAVVPNAADPLGAARRA